MFTWIARWAGLIPVELVVSIGIGNNRGETMDITGLILFVAIGAGSGLVGRNPVEKGAVLVF